MHRKRDGVPIPMKELHIDYWLLKGTRCALLPAM